MPAKRTLACVALLTLSAWSLSDDKKMEPGPKSAKESLDCIKMRSGFTAELMVAEPLVQSPIAFAWGDRSKLMPPDVVDYTRQHAPRGSPMLAIPEADHHVMLDQPLATGKWYTIAVDVDVAQHAEALTTAAFAEASLFPAGVAEIEVTVQLDSADFKIADNVRPLRIPRSGRSSNKARFDVSPLHDGAEVAVLPPVSGG